MFSSKSLKFNFLWKNIGPDQPGFSEPKKNTPGGDLRSGGRLSGFKGLSFKILDRFSAGDHFA